MNLIEQIEQLVQTTDLDNRQISDLLGCSRRHVRRVANPLRSGSVTDEVTEETAKILIFDIETSPMEVYTWSLRPPKYIPIGNIIQDWSMLSWSAKWLYDNEVMSAVVMPHEATSRVDKSIIGGLYELLNQADIVIAHNGAAFDVKKSNTRFILNGMDPCESFDIIDTKKVATKNFAFSSNKLDYLNKCLKLPVKKDTDFQLWKDCVEKDTTKQKTALEYMVSYNRNDVVVLEELYLYLRPWIKGHPNVNRYKSNETTCCPNCGHHQITWKGYYYTPAGKYASFRCVRCKALGRSRYSALDREAKETLALSVAR